MKIHGEGEWTVRQHGYSKRRTWRKVRLGLDANTTQVRAVLMTHQDVADSDVLAEPPGQIPDDELLDVIGGEGACDTKPCNAAIAARSTTPPIPPREGTAYWPARRSIAKCNHLRLASLVDVASTSYHCRNQAPVASLPMGYRFAGHTGCRSALGGHRPRDVDSLWETA